jgi:hypothetical protein
MRRFVLVVVVTTFAVAIFGPILRSRGVEPQQKAQEPRPRPKSDVEKLMAKKLEHAQKVLEGIALNDFDGIKNHARELSTISKTVEFKVFKTPQYELHANEFRRALEDMQHAVKDRNLDAAALSYVDMTLACVRCHKHVREIRVTRLPGETRPLTD